MAGPLLRRGHITGCTCDSAHEPGRRSPNRSVFTHFPVWSDINKTRSWIRKWNLCFRGTVMATPNCFIWTPVYVFGSHQYLWYDSGPSADEESNDGGGNDTGACCISLHVYPVWAETLQRANMQHYFTTRYHSFALHVLKNKPTACRSSVASSVGSTEPLLSN